MNIYSEGQEVLVRVSKGRLWRKGRISGPTPENLMNSPRYDRHIEAWFVVVEDWGEGMFDIDHMRFIGQGTGKFPLENWPA